MNHSNSVSLERGWAILLRDLGVQPENLLRRAQLPRDLLTHESARVSVDEYFRLWRALEEEADDPTLPIRLGKAISPEAFHPAVFAALCSPDLVVAVKRIGEYKRLIAPMTKTIEETPTGFFVEMRWNDPHLQVPVSLSATELVFLTEIARIATREHIQPLKVESPYPIEPVDAFEAFFGIAPERGDRHGVLFSKEDARRPFLTASEAMWDTFEPELRRRLTRLDASAPIAERVRTMLLEGLPAGEVSIQITARRLGLSARTLQRNLKREGSSYKEIVRRTREQLARHYIKNTTLAYPEISFLIGFEEPSSFFRAFREWTGETPDSMRMAVC
jgi:AraC-like DNA-binding protein